MDDSCAVCAETLEWVGYGACGHKDVCSTCVARLRFICDDRRCCICKTESDVVLVTKALGVYTETISDFSVLPSEAKEGKVGRYWYHEDTQAFVDNLDHYKMIKAMCRLSCGVCDKMEDQPDDSSRRRARFKNIEQLKGHLFHKHRLFICSLCLEGRKVFICEQKLYTRSQLTQHTNTGDSDVDGTESERGGFTGHPMCEFCRTPFYGDNELYTHMSTEHYTCHICQRQHPGQYEYYKNYDDLEMHFRRDHCLCEDEGCLGKKFIVFTSESELKRHNTLEHGGRMSRSKRNAALQIPTSFRYRRNSEQENRRGRGRMFELDPLDNELSFAIQASLETASGEPANNQTNTDHGDTIGVESSFPPLESVSITDSEQSYRYRQAVSQNSISGELGESSFPPLPVAPRTYQPNSHLDVPPTTKNMAAYLRNQNNRKAKASSSTPPWSAANRTHAEAMTNHNAWPSINAISGSASRSVQSRRVAEVKPTLPSYTTSIDTRPSSLSNSSLSASSSSSRPSVTSFSSSSSSSSRPSGIARAIFHSSSAPNLSEQESLELPSMEFPPISAAQTRKSPTVGQALTKVENVHSANKSLVEKMRAALEFDEEKFTAFRDISGEYRNDLIDSETYMAHVDQFGLSHLVLELARLLPDAQKQKDLIEAHNAGLEYNRTRENGVRNGANNGTRKGKGKSAGSNHKTSNAISFVQSNYSASEEEVEVLSKDGYRAFKVNSKIAADDLLAGTKSQIESSSVGGGANEISSNGDGKGKQRKKTSKFHRARLGDGSVEALLDLKKDDHNQDMDPNLKEASTNNSENLASRGVWKSGGGQKLFATTPKRGPKH